MSCGSGSPGRWFAPSPTVRAPKTPLYQLGWLGDDGIDVTDSTLPDSIPLEPIDPTDTGGGIPGFPTTPSYSDMLANPNLIPTTPATGTGPAMGPVPSSASSGAASSLTSAIASLFSPQSSSSLLPGASPRVSTAAPASISLASALPLLLIGGIGIVVLSSLGGGGRRRRR